MRIRNYESMVIINANIEEEQVDVIVNRIEETIRANGGELVETDKMGRKRLTYPINKARSGYYVYFRFDGPSDLIAKIERIYRLDEMVIRFMVITLDKFALAHYEKQKALKAAAKNAPAEEVSAPEVVAAVKEEAVVKEGKGEETTN